MSDRTQLLEVSPSTYDEIVGLLREHGRDVRGDAMPVDLSGICILPRPEGAVHPAQPKRG